MRPARTTAGHRLACVLMAAGLAGAVAGWDRAAAAELSAKELQSAAKLNKTKCAKCHKLYRPESYSEPDWAVWMEKMTKKSKLKPAQSELLNRYFVLLRMEKESRSAEKPSVTR